MTPTFWTIQVPQYLCTIGQCVKYAQIISHASEITGGVYIHNGFGGRCAVFASVRRWRHSSLLSQNRSDIFPPRVNELRGNHAVRQRWFRMSNIARLLPCPREPSSLCVSTSRLVHASVVSISVEYVCANLVYLLLVLTPMARNARAGICLHSKALFLSTSYTFPPQKLMSVLATLHHLWLTCARLSSGLPVVVSFSAVPCSVLIIY